MPPKKKRRMISAVMQVGLLENQVHGNVSKNEKLKLSSHATVHNNHLKSIIPGGEGNALKGQSTKPSILGSKENASKGKNPEPTVLAPSTVHNKLPMGVPPEEAGGSFPTSSHAQVAFMKTHMPAGQSSKPSVLATLSNHKKLPLSKENGQQAYVDGRRLGSALAQRGHNSEPSVLAPSTVHNKLPMGVPPVPHNGQAYVEGRRLGSALAQRGHNSEPSVLAPSTVHNKLPMGVPPVPHNGQQAYVDGRRLRSALAQRGDQENASKWKNTESSILAPSDVHNLLSAPPDVLVNERCSRGPTPTVHNYRDANCQVFMSNEALHVINRAEAELEYTLVDPSREADRQIHLSREVLEAHYEEMNNNTTTTNFPTNSSYLRKTRGPTQETAVTPPKGKKWKCLIVESQPVGQAASKLAIVLGLYARMEGYFPLHKQWKEQSPQSFKDVMKDITRDYDFVDTEGMQANMTVVTHYCYESLKKKVRDWRFWLKTHYYIDGVPDEVVMKAPDKRITQKNWELLLKYWERDDKILEAERNKRNRGEDRATHTLGAKSIARHNYDEREKLGDGYTTLWAYLKAHQTKNGDYPDQYTRAMCEKVILSCVERDVTDSSDPDILSPILDIVYKGHHGGYERGRGLGWSRAMPWSKFEATASNGNVQHLTLELQNARAEIEAMHVRGKEMEESNKEMQARLERMEALWSMHFSDASVGGSTSPSRSTHSQLPR